ncbi:MAG: hypothetical protein RI894_1941 [Bacteroidota bacterium]|jgi:hypothetical protein
MNTGKWSCINNGYIGLFLNNNRLLITVFILPKSLLVVHFFRNTVIGCKDTIFLHFKCKE